MVARTVAFSLLTLIAATIYTGSLLTILTFVPSDLRTPISVVLALLVAFTFNPLKNFLQTATERVFHKKAYSPEAVLEEIGDQVSSTLQIDTITKAVVKELEHSIHPSRSAFFLLGSDGTTTELDTKNYGFEPTPDISAKDVEFLARKAGTSILIREEAGDTNTKEFLTEHKLSVVIPLKAGKTLLGIFVLGDKASGDIYSDQDLNVLEILGPQISIAIQNALSYDEIRRFNITLKKKVKDATKDLRKANRELRHLDKLKDEFVYIATHELKTPVTVMKGYVSMIQNGDYGEVPKKLKTALDEINAANLQLVQLVNDLLGIARSEATSMKVKTKPTQICPVVDDTLSGLEPLAKQKSLKLSHTCGTSKLMVMSDPDRLKEVVNNLVSNAIKYSDSGTISITHVVEKDHIVTHVTDQGVGLSKEDQKRIFTRFFRAEEQAGRVPGTGLGTFIVKQLVEKMGGKIWFQSQLGKGTTFSFSLPKAK